MLPTVGTASSQPSPPPVGKGSQPSRRSPPGGSSQCRGLTDTVGQARGPDGAAGLTAVAGQEGAPFQHEARVAGVLDGGAHQQHGVRNQAGRVVHFPGVGAVHDCARQIRPGGR